jgi:hypothetical protein
MIDFSIFILCVGFGVGAFFISCAYAHRIFSETRMKRKALERSFKEGEPESQDELRQRLEEFRRTRFSPPVGQKPPGTPEKNKINR